MYTWRTEAPKTRRSERNMGEQPKPTKQGKASSDSTSGSISTSNKSMGPRTKPERPFHEPVNQGQQSRFHPAQAMPENSSSTQNQPAEVPEEAAASSEEGKEVPSSTPPSEQSQPAEAEETKGEYEPQDFT